MTRVWVHLPLVVLLAASLLAGGCALGGVATLESVQTGAGLLRGDVQEVQILRKGVSIPALVPRPLEVGDEISTSAAATAVVTVGRAEVLLAPSTRVQIGSLRLIIGQIYVQVLGYFEVETEYVTAGVEGTEYLVRAGPDGRVAVVVLQGAVAVKSKTARWPPVSLRRLEGAVVERESPPAKRRWTLSDINAIITWVNGVGRSTGGRPDLLVPDVIGMPDGEAVRVLTAEGFVAGAAQGRVTGAAPIGTVLETIPTAGARAPAGSPIVRVLERQSVPVPNVVGQRRGDAARTIQSQGFAVGRVSTRATGKAPPESVIGQDPAGGAAAAAGSAVDLIIEGAVATVPNVEGQSIGRARRLLGDAGFAVGAEQDVETGRAKPGTVVSQDPRAGSPAPPGTRVDLRVESEGVEVPDLRGLTIDQAQRRLSTVNLTIGRTARDESARFPSGTIIRQSPSSGSRVKPGRAVDLVIAIRPRAPDPERIDRESPKPPMPDPGQLRRDRPKPIDIPIRKPLPPSEDIK